MDLDEIKNLIELLVEDLYGCIEYEPNKENDILCFMEQYIKGLPSQRPRIMEQLLHCINDEPYKNPYAAYQHYDKKDVKEFESCLFEYLDNIGEEQLIKLIRKINKLNDKCRGQIMDNWRKERLINLLNLTSPNINVSSIVSEESVW